MSRQSRVKGEDAVYHVIQRGNERKDIFRGDHDKQRYLEILKLQQEKHAVKLYAYCLMDNHAHLLVDANGADISTFMKGLSVSYVYYFNKRYGRCGHLFQDRFRSELVNSDPYFIQVGKYIHRNPVKAKMVKEAGDYSWSSYGIYMGEEDVMHLLDTSKILDSISTNRVRAIEMYRELVGFEDQKDLFFRQFMAVEGELNILDEEKVSDLIRHASSRDEAILALKNNTGLSYRKIAQHMGGMPVSSVYRVVKKSE
ncbi:MAG TPA: transposase [Desulfosporosinus sp.]|nr:transposase [Desulfosporosinus sp.]